MSTGTRLDESRDGLATYLESMIQTVHVTADRDVNVFIFLKNDRIVMKTTMKNRKRNDNF